jgi:hypothetical protein
VQLLTKAVFVIAIAAALTHCMLTSVDAVSVTSAALPETTMLHATLLKRSNDRKAIKASKQDKTQKTANR